MEEDEKVNPDKFYPKTPEEIVKKRLNKKGNKIKSLPDNMQYISKE